MCIVDYLYFIRFLKYLLKSNFLLQYSALIRGNKPGIAAFRLANGYAALKDALGSEDVRFQRYVFLSSTLEAELYPRFWNSFSTQNALC